MQTSKHITYGDMIDAFSACGVNFCERKGEHYFEKDGVKSPVQPLPPDDNVGVGVIDGHCRAFGIAPQEFIEAYRGKVKE